MMLDLVCQHLRISHRMQRQEGLSKARRKGRLRLRDTVFGPCHLGGVARDEVEHGLGAVELGDWWQHAAGIAGEEDDVAGVVGGEARDFGVVDVFDGVGAVGLVSMFGR